MVMAAPGILQAVICPGKVQKRNMYIPTLQPAMPTAGEAGFTGCKYEDLVNAGVIAYIDHLFAMEEPPKGEISLSKTSVKAVRNGNVQKHRISHCPGITETTFQSMYQKTSPFITRQRELPQRMVR